MGKMGLRDQNDGKKIGISGPRTYHVTTLNLESRAALACAQTKLNSGQSLVIVYTQARAAHTHSKKLNVSLSFMAAKLNKMPL